MLTGSTLFSPLFCCVRLLYVQQEYKRLETLRQIKEADRRTEEMATRKEEMIAQRRKAALEVLRVPYPPYCVVLYTKKKLLRYHNMHTLCGARWYESAAVLRGSCNMRASRCT